MVSPDADGDGIADLLDNCPNDAIADQADIDDDGRGDVWDTGYTFTGFFQPVDNLLEEVTNATVAAYVRHRKEKSSLKPESIDKEVGYVSTMLRSGPITFRLLADYNPPKMPWAKVSKNSAQRPNIRMSAMPCFLI
jgi:hypothetical protein